MFVLCCERRNLVFPTDFKSPLASDRSHSLTIRRNNPNSIFCETDKEADIRTDPIGMEAPIAQPPAPTVLDAIPSRHLATRGHPDRGRWQPLLGGAAELKQRKRFVRDPA